MAQQMSLKREKNIVVLEQSLRSSKQLGKNEIETRVLQRVRER